MLLFFCGYVMTRWLWRRALSLRTGSIYRLLYPLIVICGFLFLWNRMSLSNNDSGGSDSDEPKRNVHIVVLILSQPADKNDRQLIRSTWLSDVPVDVRFLFAMGTAELDRNTASDLQDEMDEYNDLLRLPRLVEDYQSLSEKIVQSYVEINRRYRFKFLLKLDQDSFARLDEQFFAALNKVASPTLYWGFLDGRASPKTRGKWMESDWRLCEHYLPYALGGGYVLGWELVDFIARNAHLLQRYTNEDVSVGAWVAGLKVDYVHDYRFDTEYKSRGCNNQYLVSHKQSRQDIREKWHTLHMTGKLCKREVQTRLSYQYNWDVPPSKCCQREQGIP